MSAKPSKASKADPGKRAVSLAPVPKIKKAKPASVPPVKAPPLTGSAGRSVSLAQQTPKSSAPVKPVPAPPVKAPPALGSSSASAAPKPSAPVEVIEVPEGGRSSSPLPVRRATRAVETPVVASSVVVDPEEERPVIGLDYHNTIEFEHRVHPSNCRGSQDFATSRVRSGHCLFCIEHRNSRTCGEHVPGAQYAVAPAIHHHRSHSNQVAQGRGKRQVHYRTPWRKSEGDSILGGRCFCGRPGGHSPRYSKFASSAREEKQNPDLPSGAAQRARHQRVGQLLQGSERS